MTSLSFKLTLTLITLFSSALLLAFVDLSKSPSTRTFTDFQAWKTKHNIHYSSSFENNYREKIFLDKLILIKAHNSDPTQNFTRGLNKFSAMTKQEFREIYLTLISEKTTFKKNAEQQNIDYLTAASIDWRTQGAVGRVKDQGHCGACWAFSVVGGLEGVSKISQGTLQTFSEQQLIDCDLDNHGCHGGQMRRALDYVKNNGILLQTQYPYAGVQGDCKRATGNFKITGYTNVSNCHELANALTSRPITIGVDADGWDDYESGIYDNCPKQKGQYNHGVTLVGMTSQYWIIKNQWTTDWGEKGYMRLKTGDTCNVCGDGMLIHK